MLVFALALSTAPPADALDERFPAAPGGTLEVDLDLGEGLRPDRGFLEISSHDAEEVRVLVDTSGWGSGGVAFRIDPGPRAVRVFGRVDGTFAWMFGGPRIEVRIFVPSRFSVDVRTSAGPIRVEDVKGALRVRGGDGPIEVVATEGPVRLRAASGDVRVTEVVGDVDVKTSAGDIELAWIDGDVEARTGAGKIDASHVEGRIVLASDEGGIDLRDVEGSVEVKTERGGIFASFAGAPAGSLETQRGGVRVLLPEGRGAALHALSRRGDVEVAKGLDFRGEADAAHAIGRLNGGGAPLRLYTAQGGIRVQPR